MWCWSRRRAVLRERLLARGRDATDDLDRRLDREVAIAIAADLTISNVGPVEVHVAALVRFLRDLADHRQAAGFQLGCLAP